MISLPKIPYIHRLYMVLANPTHTHTHTQTTHKLSHTNTHTDTDSHTHKLTHLSAAFPAAKRKSATSDTLNSCSPNMSLSTSIKPSKSYVCDCDVCVCMCVRVFACVSDARAIGIICFGLSLSQWFEQARRTHRTCGKGHSPLHMCIPYVAHAICHTVPYENHWLLTKR